jgi:PAS domain S-box-containing protein
VDDGTSGPWNGNGGGPGEPGRGPGEPGRGPGDGGDGGGGQLAEAVRLAGVLVDVLTGAGGLLAAGGGLPDLAGRLALMACTGLDDRGRAREAGLQVGRSLAEANLTAPAVVEDVVTALGDHWLGRGRQGSGRQGSGWLGRGRQGPPVDPGCVAAIQGGVAGGHTEVVRRLLLAQQDAIHRAAFQARDDAERAAYASHARFHAVFAAAGVGIGIADLRGRILAINQSMQDMLGYPHGELQGRLGRELVHPGDLGILTDEHAALRAGRIEALQHRSRYLHRDGGAIWADLSVRLVRDPAGRPLHHVAVLTNPSTRPDPPPAPWPARSRPRAQTGGPAPPD